MKKILWAILIALCAIQVSAQTAADDERVRQRIQTAVMDVYNKALAQKPGDYDTRFARANQAYLNGDYNLALSDVEMVIAQLPEKEKETLFDAYLLKARSLDALQRYEEEAAVLQMASGLNPQSMALVDMMGKACYNLGDLDAAEQNFKTILRDSPMNYDAHYWLAQVEVKRNNYGKAAEYCDKAVSLFTANPQVYLNRADVLNQMQQYEPAAQDLISAMSVGNDNGTAMNKLIEMSDTHYDEVMNALASSSEKAPRVGMFYYLRSLIAIRQNHYGQALKSLNSIVDNQLYDYHSIYYYQALCQFELTQYDQALTSISKAIAMNDQIDPEYYLLKSRIEQFRGKGNNYAAALMTLEQALKGDSRNEALLLQKARVLTDQRSDQKALECLNQLLTVNPKNAEGLLLKGWIQKYRQNNTAAATSTFEQMLGLDDDIYSLRGFALHELGRATEARAWAQKIIQDNKIVGGESYIIASALLSDIGDFNANDKVQSLDYLRSALANGYGSLHELKVNETPYVNLKLVRRYPDFQTVIDQNSLNFEVRR